MTQYRYKLRPNTCMLFFPIIQTNESLRMNSKEVDNFDVGGGVRSIPFTLGKSSNVSTFKEGTLYS